MMIADSRKSLRLFRPTRRPRQRTGDVRVRTVLFATDLSDASRRGLPWATWLARRRRAQVLIIHIDEPLKRGEGQLYEGISGDRLNVLGRLSSFVPADPSVPSAHRLLVGDPAEEIVRLARREDVDLIVLGTHGRTGLHRLLKGSVAETVLRKARCPVFVVPQSV